MQLLINTTSPYARLARIALIEKGLDITVNGTVPGEGTYSVTLMGQKPTK